jgi:aminopeptidase N
MIQKASTRRVVAFLFLISMAFSSVARATPLPMFAAPPEDEPQKLPPVNWIRSRKIDVKHIALDLRFNWEKKQAMGVDTITVAPFDDADRFTLDAAQMTINSITTVDGKPLKFNYKGGASDDNLEILLDRTYKGGEDVTVKIDYVTNYVNSASADTAIGNFGRGLRFITPTPDDPKKPRQIWSQGESEFNRYWFPSYDSPNDFRTTELRATVEKPYFVVSNGKLVDTKDNPDGTRTFDWKMDQPYSNYLSSIVVANTTPVEQSANGIPVYNYGYPDEVKEVAATTKNLPATINFFGEITGVKYPYPKYSQTFVEDFGGGMENISATTQIEEMIHDDRELLDGDSESLQSHELAHQWFGDYVTCRDWGQIWLNESFATYMQAMWTEKFKGEDEFLYTDIKGNHDTVINTWNRGQRRPIVTKYYADKDAIFDNYAYPGGGSVLHMLRKQLGDKLFFKSLNTYLTTHAHQPVSTEDLREAVEVTSGQSMDWFFDEWLYRMGHPIFTVTQSYDDAKKQLTLNVKQTQKLDVANAYPQTEFFQSWVDVEIDNNVERVWMEPKAENVFTFNVAAKPKLVNWDYQSALLKEMTFDKSTDELLYQLQNDKDVLGRKWALDQLKAKLDNAADRDKILAAMTVSAEKDPFWRIRRDALGVVGEAYVPLPKPGESRVAAKLDPSVEALVTRLTKDPESLIRADAVEILGATQDKKYENVFTAALNDRSYSVIEDGARALGELKDPASYEALSKLATTPSWHGRIMIAGLNGLAELGDKRAFDVSYKVATDTSLPLSQRSAALAAVGATGKGDPRAYPLIYDQFKKAMDSQNIQGIINSMAAVVKIADPRGQEVFDQMKAKFKDNANAMQFITAQETEFKSAIGH